MMMMVSLEVEKRKATARMDGDEMKGHQRWQVRWHRGGKTIVQGWRSMRGGKTEVGVVCLAWRQQRAIVSGSGGAKMPSKWSDSESKQRTRVDRWHNLGMGGDGGWGGLADTLAWGKRRGGGEGSDDIGLGRRDLGLGMAGWWVVGGKKIGWYDWVAEALDV